MYLGNGVVYSGDISVMQGEDNNLEVDLMIANGEG